MAAPRPTYAPSYGPSGPSPYGQKKSARPSQPSYSTPSLASQGRKSSPYSQPSYQPSYSNPGGSYGDPYSDPSGGGGGSGDPLDPNYDPSMDPEMGSGDLPYGYGPNEDPTGTSPYAGAQDPYFPDAQPPPNGQAYPPGHFAPNDPQRFGGQDFGGQQQQSGPSITDDFGNEWAMGPGGRWVNTDGRAQYSAPAIEGTERTQGWTQAQEFGGQGGSIADYAAPPGFAPQGQQQGPDDYSVNGPENPDWRNARQQLVDQGLDPEAVNDWGPLTGYADPQVSPGPAYGGAARQPLGTLEDQAPDYAGPDAPGSGGGQYAPGDVQLTPDELRAIAEKVGFRGQALDTAVKVLMQESGGHTGALNVNSDGSVDRGIAQFNDHYHGEISDDASMDPYESIKHMFDVSQGGTDWQAWSVDFSDGRLNHQPTSGGGIHPELRQALDAVDATGEWTTAEQSDPNAPPPGVLPPAESPADHPAPEVAPPPAVAPPSLDQAAKPPPVPGAQASRLPSTGKFPTGSAPPFGSNAIAAGIERITGGTGHTGPGVFDKPRFAPDAGFLERHAHTNWGAAVGSALDQAGHGLAAVGKGTLNGLGEVGGDIAHGVGWLARHGGVTGAVGMGGLFGQHPQPTPIQKLAQRPEQTGVSRVGNLTASGYAYGFNRISPGARPNPASTKNAAAAALQRSSRPQTSGHTTAMFDPNSKAYRAAQQTANANNARINANPVTAYRNPGGYSSDTQVSRSQASGYDLFGRNPGDPGYGTNTTPGAPHTNPNPAPPPAPTGAPGPTGHNVNNHEGTPPPPPPPPNPNDWSNWGGSRWGGYHR